MEDVWAVDAEEKHCVRGSLFSEPRRHQQEQQTELHDFDLQFQPGLRTRDLPYSIGLAEGPPGALFRRQFDMVIVFPLAIQVPVVF